MTSRRLHRIVPTLLALGLMPAAWAATSGPERDAHMEAVQSLIEREFRLPAQRQLADFLKAGHPDAAWHGKYLTWFYADRFRTLSPDSAERTKLEAEAKTLLAELSAAEKAKQLPEAVLREVSGSSRVIRLVNDLLKVIGQDQAHDRLGAQAVVAERRAALNATAAALIAATNAALTDGLAAVKANAKAEEEGWALDDRDPKFLAMAKHAVELRLDGLRPIFFAVRVLRELAERGEDFGLDPAPAKAFLEDFAKKQFATLQEWDYTWGDFHPYLRSILVDLAAQAGRYKVRTAQPDALAADYFALLDMDVAKEFRDPNVAEEIRTLQARTWAALLAWYRELGRDLGPTHWQKGLDAYQQFRDRTRNDRHFRLDHANRDRAIEVARLHFQAARLQAAKGDTAAAAGTFSMVAAVRTNPLAGNAAQWAAVIGGNRIQIGAGAWGGQPVAEDPATAVLTAGALLRAASASPDPVLQRSSLLTAAVSLRNGVLGLGSAAFAEGADEAAPELWFRYAETMSRLGMRWHAALVAQAGLRHLAARMEEHKERSPWKTRDGKWTTSGRFISPLARNAVTYASILLSAGRSPAITQLYDESISLVNRVSPADGGKALDRIQIIIRIQEKQFQDALAAVDAYVKKYPEEAFDGASLRSSVYIGWYDATTNAGERKTIADRALKEAETVAAQAEKALDSEKDPARRRILNAARRDVQALKAFLALREDKPETVIEMLGPDYWRNPPSDEDKAVQMLGYLCQALRQWYTAEVKEEARRADPKVLLAAWPRIEQTYATWKAQKDRLPASGERITGHGLRLAWVFQMTTRQAEAMRRGEDGERFANIATTSNRAFADLIDPSLHAGSDPNTLLGVGNVLWDLGDTERALRLYELFMAKAGTDPELTALRDTPKEVLAPLDALLAPRPELRTEWNLVKDLLIDDPDLARKIIEFDLAEKDWGEKKRDFLLAVAAIRTLRTKVDANRMALGANFQAIQSGLARLDDQVAQLGREISVTAKLAQGHREAGRKDQANRLYEQLIAYDPTNPDFLAATVELTIDQLRDGVAVAPDVLERTRIKAARVRDSARNGSPTYWTAVIQVMELSLAMRDVALVNRRLQFDAVNQSTPADDLQQLPRNRRDDPRLRRARNPLTVELCRRYLAIFEQPGITIKPSFAIRDVDWDGGSMTVFVPVGAPAFTVVSRELDDGTTVSFFWEEGKEPPPEPEAPPETPATPVAQPEATP